MIGFQGYITKKIPNRYFYAFVVFLLSVIVGIRENVGADWGAYYVFYYSGVAPEKESGVYEPVFMLIRHVCYYLGFNHTVFFFIQAFASLYALYIVTTKLGIKNVYLSFFIYFSIVFTSYQFNTVRNGVMASILWLAFVYRMEGKNLKAVIATLVAAGFHVVALAFLPIMYFIIKELSRKSAFLMIGLCLTAVFLRFGERIIGMFPFLAAIDRLSGYIDTDETESYGISLGTVFNILLFLYMMIGYHKQYKTQVELRGILNAMLMAIMVVCFFNAFHAIVSRVGQVLNLALMFVWPYLIERVKVPLIKFSICSVLCAYLWLYYAKGLEATVLYSNRLAYIPYEWSFDGIFR